MEKVEMVKNLKVMMKLFIKVNVLPKSNAISIHRYLTSPNPLTIVIIRMTLVKSLIILNHRRQLHPYRQLPCYHRHLRLKSIRNARVGNDIHSLNTIPGIMSLTGNDRPSSAGGISSSPNVTPKSPRKMVRSGFEKLLSCLWIVFRVLNLTFQRYFVLVKMPSLSLLILTSMQQKINLN